MEENNMIKDIVIKNTMTYECITYFYIDRWLNRYIDHETYKVCRYMIYMSDQKNAKMNIKKILGIPDSIIKVDNGIFTDDIGNNTFDPKDKFIDKREMDNMKLKLKGSMKYKIPDKNIDISLNFGYSMGIDNLKGASEQKAPQYKVKLAIKYSF